MPDVKLPAINKSSKRPSSSSDQLVGWVEKPSPADSDTNHFATKFSSTILAPGSFQNDQTTPTTEPFHLPPPIKVTPNSLAVSATPNLNSSIKILEEEFNEDEDKDGPPTALKCDLEKTLDVPITSPKAVSPSQSPSRLGRPGSGSSQAPSSRQVLPENKDTPSDSLQSSLMRSNTGTLGPPLSPLRASADSFDKVLRRELSRELRLDEGLGARSSSPRVSMSSGISGLSNPSGGRGKSLGVFYDNLFAMNSVGEVLDFIRSQEPMDTRLSPDEITATIVQMSKLADIEERQKLADVSRNLSPQLSKVSSHSKWSIHTRTCLEDIPIIIERCYHVLRPHHFPKVFNALTKADQFPGKLFMEKFVLVMSKFSWDEIYSTFDKFLVYLQNEGDVDTTKKAVLHFSAELEKKLQKNTVIDKMTFQKIQSFICICDQLTQMPPASLLNRLSRCVEHSHANVHNEPLFKLFAAYANFHHQPGHRMFALTEKRINAAFEKTPSAITSGECTNLLYSFAKLSHLPNRHVLAALSSKLGPRSTSVHETVTSPSRSNAQLLQAIMDEEQEDMMDVAWAIKNVWALLQFDLPVDSFFLSELDHVNLNVVDTLKPHEMLHLLWVNAKLGRVPNNPLSRNVTFRLSAVLFSNLKTNLASFVNLSDCVWALAALDRNLDPKVLKYASHYMAKHLVQIKANMESISTHSAIEPEPETPSAKTSHRVIAEHETHHCVARLMWAFAKCRTQIKPHRYLELESVVVEHLVEFSPDRLAGVLYSQLIQRGEMFEPEKAGGTPGSQPATPTLNKFRLQGFKIGGISPKAINSPKFMGLLRNVAPTLVAANNKLQQSSQDDNKEDSPDKDETTDTATNDETDTSTPAPAERRRSRLSTSEAAAPDQNTATEAAESSTPSTSVNPPASASKDVASATSQGASQASAPVFLDKLLCALLITPRDFQWLADKLGLFAKCKHTPHRLVMSSSLSLDAATRTFHFEAGDLCRLLRALEHLGHLTIKKSAETAHTIAPASSSSSPSPSTSSTSGVVTERHTRSSVLRPREDRQPTEQDPHASPFLPMLAQALLTHAQDRAPRILSEMGRVGILRLPLHDALELLWALTYLQTRPDATLMHYIDQHLEHGLVGVEFQVVVSLLWSYGNLEHVPSPSLLAALTEYLSFWVHLLTPRSASTVLWAFAIFNHHPGPTILGATEKLLSDAAWHINLEPRPDYELLEELSRTFWAQASLGHSPQSDFRDVMDSALDVHLDAFEPNQLASILWSHVSLGIPLDEELRHRVVSTLQRDVQSLTPANCCTTLWCLATLQHYPGVEFMLVVAQHMIADISNFTHYDVTTTLHSYATLAQNVNFTQIQKMCSHLIDQWLKINSGFDPTTANSSLQKNAGKRGIARGVSGSGPPKVELRFLPQMLWALVHLKHQPEHPDFLVDAERIFTLRMHEFGPDDFSTILWAFAQMKHMPAKPTMEAALGIFETNVRNFDVKNCSKVMAAMATIGTKPSWDLLKDMDEFAAKHFHEFDIGVCADLIFAFVQFRYVPFVLLISAKCEDTEGVTKKESFRADQLQTRMGILMIAAQCPTPAVFLHNFKHLIKHHKMIGNQKIVVTPRDTMKEDMLSFYAHKPHISGLEGESIKRRLAKTRPAYLKDVESSGPLHPGCSDSYQVSQRTSRRRTKPLASKRNDSDEDEDREKISGIDRVKRRVRGSRHSVRASIRLETGFSWKRIKDVVLKQVVHNQGGAEDE